MKTRTGVSRAIVSFTLALMATGAVGCGGSGGTGTCTNTRRDYQCVNSACVCTSGPQKDKSCCNPEDSSCAAAQKCTAFCEYCASGS